ncbi:toll-like receptor 2 [Spea bombifrons]|uniref:toll-like receptor 2 n=1 Tax=Spea bombifrons TaxID=233779 RepID=UPI00234AA95D|nr:toll-like receptor 2 [Spea bombifrons]
MTSALSTGTPCRHQNTMMYYICKIAIIYSLVIISEAMATCICDSKSFCDCSSRNLTSVPSGLPREIKGLDLSNNKIQILSETDLEPYEYLEILCLEHNEIHTISDYAFHSLGNLKDLDLSYNKLTNLSSAWYSNLHMLTHLNIMGNLYSTLGYSPLFTSLTSLTSLKVGNPDLISIEKKNFHGLESLKEFHLNIPNLKVYENRSMEGVKDIGHIILNVNKTFLYVLMSDLVFSVTVLEIKNMSLLVPDDVSAFGLFNKTRVRRLIFKNCVITDKSSARLFELIQHYQDITDFVLEDSELLGTGHGDPLLHNDNSSITTVIIQNLNIPNFYLFSDLRFFYKVVKHLKSITCTGTKVFLIPCNFSRSFLSMEYLDVSGNLLTDIFLASSSCFLERGGAWPMLRTLNVSKNLLSHLPFVAQMLSGQQYLTNLDLSQNKFGDSTQSACKWSAGLMSLNLSNCQIKHISDCLPATLEMLDLSYNYLTTFVTELPFLKELHLTNNRLAKLPVNARLPRLMMLFIRTNKLSHFYESDLNNFPQLTTLDARDNNYDCSCEFLDYVQFHSALLLGWPANYICDSPTSVRNKRIQDAKLPILKCHKVLFVTLSCIILILLIAVVVALCYFFHLIWYVKMTWAWLQAKRKPLKTTEREICYNAFISYSEMDSEWVENMMVEELENTTPPLRLCLHKRDFTPGKWIIDNIIDAMEKSYKTLFILSEHFVQSEWCKYELEFSHFRLFDENSDTAILIILEPMEKESIPKRFYKLRKLMNTKTYMEWPTDEEQQRYFWQNLKTALQIETYEDA